MPSDLRKSAKFTQWSQWICWRRQHSIVSIWWLWVHHWLKWKKKLHLNIEKNECQAKKLRQKKWKMSDSEVSNMSDSGSDARSDVSNRSRSGTPRSRSRSCKLLLLDFDWFFFGFYVTNTAYFIILFSYLYLFRFTFEITLTIAIRYVRIKIHFQHLHKILKHSKSLRMTVCNAICDFSVCIDIFVAIVTLHVKC